MSRPLQPHDDATDPRQASGQYVPPALAATAARRAAPSNLRGGRRPVYAADLDVYAAIVGRPPTVEERGRALEPPPVEPYALAPFTHAGLARNWSPALLCAHLRSVCVCYTGRALRARRPQVAGWVRRVSGEARRVVEATQARIRHVTAGADEHVKD